MNDDQPTSRLEALRAEHRRLDADISARLDSGEGDMLELARLKKRKLRIKDEIQVLLDVSIPDIIA
jgi:hypothetical protein